MLSFNFNPFPILFTERLRLRRMTEADAAHFFEMRRDPDIMKYIARPLAKTVDDAVKLIRDTDDAIRRNELINWGITFREEDKVIGTIGFYRMKPEHHRGEIGYMLNPKYHRQGIINEAVETAIKYGFGEMKLHSIEGCIDPRNSASEKVLLKNNFVKEAHYKENYFFEGEYYDSVHYSLLTYLKD
jgi:ribosomal-protein-alanine N-acetyltransferase